MKFTEYSKEVEDKDFKIVENVLENVLASYDITYSFAGKSLTESIEVAGLSKKTTKKRLEDAKRKLRGKVRVISEGTHSGDVPGTDVIRADYMQYVFPQGFYSDLTLAPKNDIMGVVLYVTLQNPEKIVNCIHQMEDALATVSQLGQKNRAADLEIRLSICKLALSMNDHLGKYPQE